MTSINTRADLDALTGTPAHAAFVAALAGTIYRLEKDDAALAWGAVLDTSSIERFGFTLDDFPGAIAPELPEYVVPVVVPTAITMRQARLALLGAGLLTQVNAAIAAMPGDAGEAARIEWEYASIVERNSGLIPAMGAALGMTGADLDALFAAAKGL